MTTMTTTYEPTAINPRVSRLRQILAGAALFDAAGGVFCLAAASQLSRWLSIPRSSTYVTGALFLVAAAVGAVTRSRQALKLGWIAGANEVFAAWCLVMLAADKPNALGAVLLATATASSAGTGFAELRLARHG